MRSRVAPTSRDLAQGQQPRDDLAELLGGVRGRGPAPAARPDSGLGLARKAPADQLGLQRGVGEALHRALEDEPGRLGVLDVGDLVDLPGCLAVPARPLVRVGDGLAGHQGELTAHGAQEVLLGGDVLQAGADAVGPGLEAGELGAHLETLGERGRDLGDDRRRGHAGQHLERLLPRLLSPAEPGEEIGTPGAHIDQLPLQSGGQLIKVACARIEVKPQTDDRCACDPDIDVPRGRDSLGGSHSAIIAAR